MTAQMIQVWDIGGELQAGTKIIEDLKDFFASRNNSAEIKALCSLSLPAFLCPQAGSDSKLVK